MVGIVFLSFYVFGNVRHHARLTGVYTEYKLDLIDFGYDMGNVFLNLLEKFKVKLIPPIQSIFGMFAGTYKVPEGGVKIDYDHRIILESLDKVEYHTLSHSILKLSILPCLLLLLGIVLFNRRDLS